MNLAELFKKKPKRFLSIDFGQAFIKILYLESKAAGLSLLSHDVKKISFTDQGKPEIINFIKTFIEKNSILEKDAYLNIADPDSILIKHLTLPHLPKQEILGAAKWQLKDIVPDDLESYISSWQIVKEFVDEQGAKKNLLVFALAKKDAVNRHTSLIAESGLSPVSISTDPFNYSNILRHCKETGETQAILDINYKDSAICVYKNTKLQFIRRLPYSTEKIVSSLTGTILSDKGKIDLSEERACEIIEESGIPQDSLALLKDNIKAMQVVSLIRPILEQLVRELGLSFEYYSSNYKEEMPSALYISGEGSGLKNLGDHLSKELNIKVSRIPLPDCLRVQGAQRDRLEKDQGYILSPVGSGLADIHSINLLPKEIRAKRTELLKEGTLRVFFITFTVIFLFLLLFVRIQAKDYQGRLKNANRHLQAIREIKILNKDIEEKEALVAELRAAKIPADGLLRLISSIVPPEVMLDELYLDQTGHKLTIKGTITAKEQIVEKVLTLFMEKMERSPFFIEATLASSVRGQDGQIFEIRGDLAH